MVAGVGVAVAALVQTATASNCTVKEKNIVETAASAGNFETLIAAAKAADLVGVLTSDGPFTVFAPTDDAFTKLPTETLKGLLAKPEQLAAILKYHVVPGKVTAADVVKLASAKTAMGQTVAIDATDGVMINNAKVIHADIAASNGIIHVIDTVLMPRADIVETARAAGSFTTLLAALEAAGLTAALQSEGPFTLFAPTDDAFGKLPAGTVPALLSDIPKLQAILTYHVVPGRVPAAQVTKLDEAETLQGQTVRIRTSSGVMIDEARVVKTDVFATNGVIHVIDAVILPN